MGLATLRQNASAYWDLKRRIHRIAVLGRPLSGKTTLIDYWRGQWSERNYTPTLSPTLFKKIKAVSGNQQFRLRRLTDVSGDPDHWPDWESAALESRNVLYLVKGDDLAKVETAGRYVPEWTHLIDDAGQIRPWLDNGRAQGCVVVVTRRDLDPRFGRLGPDTYETYVRQQLDRVVLKLGGYARVQVITGSLADQAAAAATTLRIMSAVVARKARR